jgi:hypothetical protein
VTYKALSILQPWAWLIVNGHKDIENRNWRTSFRGRFIVHAGKKWGREQREDLARVRDQFPRLVIPNTFDLGGLVGAATITDCVGYSESPWFVGSFGFVIADAKPCVFTPWRGQLGWFDIDADASCIYAYKQERTHDASV